MPFELPSLVPHLAALTREDLVAGGEIPVLDHGYLRYVAHLGDDLTPLEAARMSTGNASGVDPQKDAATRDYLWRHHHSTPFEMAVLQIEVQVPIFVAREWHRHRTQCLAGETRLFFDLPGSRTRAKDNQLHTVSVADFHHRWHHGTQHPISKRKPTFEERIDVERWYSVPELSALVERRKEDLRNLIREGKLEARREEVRNPRQASLFVQGKAWLCYAGQVVMAHVPMQDRLQKMTIRMCDESTGAIAHTTVTDVWQSGVKPTFKVTFENGYSIATSKDHRFLTREGWMTLEQATGLKLGPTGAVSWRADAPRFAANGVPAYQDQEWLAARRAEGLDVQAIADQAQCSYPTIRKWLKIHGLQFSAAERARLSGASQQGQRRSFTKHDLSEDARRRIAAARSGPRSNFWKGGVTSDRHNIGRWTREQGARVHAANDYRCLLCNMVGGKLHAHHLDPVWHSPDRALDLANLVSVCDDCHRRLHALHLELDLLEAVKTGRSLEGFLGESAIKGPVQHRTATAPRTMVAHYVAIASIAYAGEQETYDLEVAGPYHNFVADGMVVHNSFNEFSGRYSQMPALYYEPSAERVQGQSTTNKQGSGHELSSEVVTDYLTSLASDQDQIRHHYEGYLDAGVARELARINLPLSQYTRFRAQANLRNWLHFLNLRMAPNAQHEIRVYAHTLARAIALLWPETWAVFREHTLEGATLSLSERRVVARLLQDALGAESEQLGAALLERIGSELPPARARELLAKLGLT